MQKVRHRAALSDAYYEERSLAMIAKLHGLPKHTFGDPHCVRRVTFTSLDAQINSMISLAEDTFGEGATVENVFGRWDSAEEALAAFAFEENPESPRRLTAKESARLNRYIALAKALGRE